MDNQNQPKRYKLSMVCSAMLLAVGTMSTLGHADLSQPTANPIQAMSAAESEKYFLINEVPSIRKIEDLTWEGSAQQLSWNRRPMAGDISVNECTGSNQGRPNGVKPFEADEVSLKDVIGVFDDMIAFGKKIWTIVEDNKPVVHVESYRVHVLPQGMSCWSDLENWQLPKSSLYEIAYTNLLGMDVVKFRFRTIFNYGGSLPGGKGKYLANAAVIPAEVSVMWMHNFRAEVEVGQVLNMSSKESPTAGMGMNVHWQVKNPLIDTQRNVAVFMTGAGELQVRE